MTLTDQIQAAIVSHKLEFGKPPNYIDAAPDVFTKLGGAVEVNKAPRCIIVDQVAVFTEPTVPRNTFRVVDYDLNSGGLPPGFVEVLVDALG